MTGPNAQLTPEGWRPGISLPTLRLRARILAQIREFFAQRGVLEVETPALSRRTVTDPNIQSLEAGGGWFLQTSPEYAMKRLLAAGSGPIYQICRAFRDGEAGSRHNPEFTLLEWYQPGFDHHQLMHEVDALIGRLLGMPAARRLSYAEAFATCVGIDPMAASRDELVGQVIEGGLAPAAATCLDRDGLLDYLFATRVQPGLDPSRPVFVHGFPASQAALARLAPGDPPLAERFELFVAGIELANGYHELTDPTEQGARFRADQVRRRALGLQAHEPDERLLAALRHGLPDCAGVALGVDRLVMVAASLDDISAAMTFASSRA